LSRKIAPEEPVEIKSWDSIEGFPDFIGWGQQEHASLTSGRVDEQGFSHFWLLSMAMRVLVSRGIRRNFWPFPMTSMTA